MDTIQEGEQELARLRERIRVEAGYLEAMRGDADRLERSGADGRPFIGPGYVVGLVLGIPLWSTAAYVWCWVAR